jgi:hypothetical protein
MKFKYEEIGGVSYENKEEACWISKHREGEYEGTYCMKPIRLDVRSSAGRRMLFIVAFGQLITEDEEGFKIFQAGHGASGGSTSTFYPIILQVSGTKNRRTGALFEATTAWSSIRTHPCT